MPTKPLPHALLDRLARVEALDVPAKKAGKKIRDTIPKGPVKDALAGTPLGHALHPLLTDVPIGTWTSAAILDLIGGADGERAADKLIATGLLAAVPTVASGYNDWADTEVGSDGVRRVGIVHAALNATSAMLMTASYVARKRGDRGRGKRLSALGCGALMAGGWLGGHLSYAQGVGVDNTVFETGAQEWTPAAAESALQDGRAICTRVDGEHVLLVRQNGRVHALANRCVHRGGPLHEGELGDGTITCPWHDSAFALDTGSVLRGPAAYPQPVYETRVVDGQIEVRRGAR